MFQVDRDHGYDLIKLKQEDELVQCGHDLPYTLGFFWQIEQRQHFQEYRFKNYRNITRKTREEINKMWL